jgi:hypothetical protein
MFFIHNNLNFLNHRRCWRSEVRKHEAREEDPGGHVEHRKGGKENAGESPVEVFADVGHQATKVENDEIGHSPSDGIPSESHDIKCRQRENAHGAQDSVGMAH